MSGSWDSAIRKPTVSHKSHNMHDIIVFYEQTHFLVQWFLSWGSSRVSTSEMQVQKEKKYWWNMITIEINGWLGGCTLALPSARHPCLHTGHLVTTETLFTSSASHPCEERGCCDACFFFSFSFYEVSPPRVPLQDFKLLFVDIFISTTLVPHIAILTQRIYSISLFIVHCVVGWYNWLLGRAALVLFVNPLPLAGLCSKPDLNWPARGLVVEWISDWHTGKVLCCTPLWFCVPR